MKDILSAAHLAALTALIALGPSAATEDARADAGEAEVIIAADAQRIIHTMRGGVGASWHAIETPIPIVNGRSHGGSAWGGHPPAEDRQAWQRIYDHADWLGFDFIRVEVEQRMFEPERGRFTWDTPEMRILYRILDWCEKRQADVFLQNMWGNVDWNAFPEFRGDAVKRVHSGPASMEAFADGLAALMKHLTRTKRYTCIQWLCINNEPGHPWSWWQEPPNEPISLRAGLSAVRRALDREGLRVPLSGPDWTDLPELKPDKIDFDEFIASYDLHSYYARFDWAAREGYSLADAEQRLRGWTRWAHERGKPLFLSEVGSMAFGWGGSDPGPATFEAALKDAELVVRAMNLGVDAFNRWSFINRGDLDGQWQMINTWDRERKVLLAEFTPQPNPYFVYGLISRLTAKHSQVATCAVRGGQSGGLNRVFATALRSSNGNSTCIVINDAPRTWEASFDLQGLHNRPLHQYQVTAEKKDNPRLQISPLAAIEPGKGSFRQTLPPMSLTVFSTYERKHSQTGIIVD